MEDLTPTEPTVLSAVRRYWILVLACALGLGLLGYAFTSISTRWQATSSVLIQDPASGRVFESGTVGNLDRFVSDQVAIVQSPTFAREVLSEAELTDSVSLEALLASTTVRVPAQSSLISITVRADEPEQAIRLANAYLVVYERLRLETSSAGFEIALRELNRSISEVDNELEEIAVELRQLSASPQNEAISVQLEELIDRLLNNPPTGAELAALVQRLQAMQLAQSIGGVGADLSLFLDQRTNALSRRSQLLIRRDQLTVDASLSLSGVVQSSDAIAGVRATSRSRTTAAAFVIGAMIGVIAAFLAAMRNRRFTNRLEPAGVLGAPLFAEIPLYRAYGAGAQLPIVSSPTSYEAEAFRFASEGITLVKRRPDNSGFLSHPTDRDGSIVVFTSALVGDGKTTVAVNTALGTATSGSSVLIVDADFGDPSATHLLTGGIKPEYGLTDAAGKSRSLESSITRVDVGDGLEVDLLARGSDVISAPDFFRLHSTGEFFSFLRARYDFIFIDSPPLLQISYATSVVGLSDSVVVVVPHRGSVSMYEDLSRTLSMIGTPAIGYIYNKAPTRPEMPRRRTGSLLDPLGAGRALSQ